MVFLVFSPVQYLNDDVTSEWPLEVLVMFPSHESSIYRHMSTLTTAITISIHHEAQFVTLWVRVEWWTVVLVVELLAFGKFCECEITYRLVDSERVLPGWGLVEESSGVDNYITHSQLQAVILQILSVECGVVAQVSVRDEQTGSTTT